MNWAHHAILKLQSGEQATINPRGSSMRGKVESGDTVVVAPVPPRMCKDCEGGRFYDPEVLCEACDSQGWVADLNVGDIVLCKVKGNVYLHLISAIRGDGEQYQISNNHGHVNGWIKLSGIYGVAISVAGRVVKVLPKES